MPSTGRSWPADKELAGVVGSHIREGRAGRGLSQRQLAREVELSNSMIAKYEGGMHMPSASMLVRLAVVLRVTVDGLLGYPGLDPSLGRFLRTVDGMDERTRRFALETLDGIVNTYQALSSGRQDQARE